MTQKTEHRCHAMGCEAPCKPEKLMCRRHWCMVPADLKRQVYRHYQEGQCDGRVTPTQEWHKAANAAIQAVFQKEKNFHKPRQMPRRSTVTLPLVPSLAHLESIAMRYRHDFGLLEGAERESALNVARQMYHEVTGQGFFQLPEDY